MIFFSSSSSILINSSNSRVAGKGVDATVSTVDELYPITVAIGDDAEAELADETMEPLGAGVDIRLKGSPSSVICSISSSKSSSSSHTSTKERL